MTGWGTWRVTLTIVAALAAGAVVGASGRSRGTTPAPCVGPAYREFDFFVGDWDAYDVATPSKPIARNRVTIVLGGCVVREVYEQADGLVGESLSLYDASRQAWHQSWVTNRGALALLDGRFEGGRMVLAGSEHAPDGTTSLLRGIWRVEGSAVRETAVRSTDGGTTWKPAFDILFRPRGRRADR